MNFGLPKIPFVASRIFLPHSEGEIPFENYIKIDNTNLSASETAKIIKERFSLWKGNF